METAENGDDTLQSGMECGYYGEKVELAYAWGIGGYMNGNGNVETEWKHKE